MRIRFKRGFVLCWSMVMLCFCAIFFFNYDSSDYRVNPLKSLAFQSAYAFLAFNVFISMIENCIYLEPTEKKP